MVRSMTGFGRGEATAGGFHITVEVRSVNHRFLDLSLRSPRTIAPLEDRVRVLVSEHVTRGRVDFTVALEEHGEREKRVDVDIPLAKGYLASIAQLQRELGLDGEVPLQTVLGLPQVVSVKETVPDLEELWGGVRTAGTAALKQLVEMRDSEGRRLATDFNARLDLIAEVTGEIENRAPEVVREYRTRLDSRIRELLGDAMVDEARLLQEVAIFADRVSVVEELVRLGSHITEARATLGEDGGGVGRKLEFVLQEMNREVNTIGSKANDAIIARQVIAIKAELEKMREQIQNIE